MENILKKNNQKGSLMVEALALLGLITMVTPILYKKAAERTTELQDINVATQMRMISGAVDDFLRDNYKEVGETYSDDVFSLSDADMENLEKYLPKGFDLTQSRMFENFQVMVNRQEVEDKKGIKHNIYTSAVLAPTTEQLTRMRSSKIAAMIGASGGVYRDGMLQGVQGSWSAPVSDFGFTTDGVKDESLAVISTKAIASAKGDVSSDEVLFRVDTGDEGSNTMQTALLMDGNEIRGLTNLIASSAGGNGAEANEIVIGRKNDNNAIADLFVTGSVNIKKALTVEEKATFNQGFDVLGGETNLGKTTISDLTVTGSTSLQNTNVGGSLNVAGNTTLNETTINGATTINGDLTQNGGDVNFNSNSITMNSSGPVNITSTGDSINIDAAKNLTVNGGDSVVIQQGGTDRLVINDGGNTITGDTVFQNGDVKVEKNFTVEGDATVLNNLNVAGDVKVEGDVVLVREEGEEANVLTDWLHATKGIKVGGKASEKTSSGNYFTVDSTETAVKTDKFTVATDRVIVDSAKSFIGYNYNGGSNFSGFTSNDSEQRIQQGSNSYLSLKDTSWTLKTQDADNKGAIVEVEPNGNLRFDTRGFLLDDMGLAISSNDTDLRGKSSVKEITGLDGSLLVDSGVKVAVSRQGIIEVAPPTGTSDYGGYIRARRLVSDLRYPEDDNFHGEKVSKKYDYYQVNPAYTSVMNDIKLATRGGARLSDILPDYINKGIYVADNTYRNSSVSGWEGKWLRGVDECLAGNNVDNTCIASPWLGYVPAPQCPRNYAKVITLNPIRWRMSEVYQVANTVDWPTDRDEYQRIIGGDRFNQYFIPQRNPRAAYFALSNSNGGETHTHETEQGRPLTFQTNTWLNTTVSPLYGNSCYGDGVCNTEGSPEEFVGWHTVMGFIYRPTQYVTLLNELGVSTSSDVVYWNLFPVYAGDMAAVANVYCYFERNSESGWQWGEPVYKYDQMSNYHHGYMKDDRWSEAVNDPQLGYDDAW